MTGMDATMTSEDLHALSAEASAVEGSVRALRALRAELCTRALAIALNARSVSAHLRRLQGAVLAAPHSVTIDPEDALDAVLAGVGRSTQLSARELSGLAQEPSIGLIARLMLRLAARQLMRQHADVQRLRLLLREHDADASPRGRAYDSADDLIASLRAPL